MIKLSDFFSPLGVINISIFFSFIACCEIIGFSLAKTFIKKIPEFLRGAIWLLGLGLIVFFYFLSHFFLPFSFPTIIISLGILLIPSIKIYLEEKGWQSLFLFLRWSRLPFVLLLPILPLVFIKCSLPPYTWDEMAYHYISPYILYHEQVWRFGSSFAENLPRLLETAYIALFSLAKTYTTARLLHLSIFITALMVVYKFLKDNFGQIPALVYFILSAYHSEDLFFQATIGYIDVGTSSLIIIGVICLISFLLKNEIEFLIFGAAFWGMAAGAKYSALTPMVVYLLMVLVIFFKRRLWKREYLKNYLLAILFFIILGGYWYFKNVIYKGNPFYPFLFEGEIGRYSKGVVFAWWTTPFSLANASSILLEVLSESRYLVFFLLLSVPLSFLHSEKTVRKLALILVVGFCLEVLIAAQVSNYEPRFFYHWQFLTILLMVLPMTPLFNYKKLAKKILSPFLKR